jgi:hypothetical protein
MSDERGQIDVEEVRARLPMAEVCAREGVVLRKMGAWLVGLCPFHEERSGSFQIGSQRPDRAVCRGCGWTGDIFQFWMQRRDVDFAQALRELASLCGVAPSLQGVKWTAPKGRKVSRVTAVADAPREKPALPRFRGLRDEEIEQLAVLRGLSVEGVRVAAHTFRRVGFCAWPQWQGRDWQWRPGCGVSPCWVVTDESRWVAQFRRLDGLEFEKGKGGGGSGGDAETRRPGDGEKKEVTAENAEGAEKKEKRIKAWTKGSPTWPIGAGELGVRKCELLVEGGADMLAAFHFLNGFGQLGKVGVVCMLGAGNRMAADALRFFAGVRVRIMMDADPEKALRSRSKDGGEKVKYIRPGMEAAARWTQQLTEAGAAVEVFGLYDLVTAAGAPVKDLNDLALCSEQVIGSEEIMEAFCEWEF